MRPTVNKPPLWQLPATTLDYLAPRARVSYFFVPLRAAESADLGCEAEAAH